MTGRVVLEVPAKPEFLLLARLAATSVGRSAGASEETIADLKLAVTEAVANAVRHAYPPDDPGRVTVELVTTPGKLEIAVCDTGKGLGGSDHRPSSRPGGNESGMGLSIIRAIADEVDLGEGPDGRGTRVSFVCAL
ncbi:MAG TPA: ATP-binding protein [Gaiella sp.]|jgi:serine/threonine-protein kinase RsbW